VTASGACGNASDFAGWGDPARRPGLSPVATAWLQRELGPCRPSRPVALPEVRVRPGALPGPLRAALRAAVGAEHVQEDHGSRVRHAAGKSYLDLLRMRAGQAEDAPDAVVLPGSAAQVASVLRACVDAGVAVVPFGGGTSVVGGVAPLRGRFPALVSVDLQRMDRLLQVDTDAQTATFEAGVRGPAAEAALAAYGLTLGHLPQSFERASLGGYAATRSAGQASTGYGRFEDLVAGVAAETPAGPLRLGRGPATAAGPDLLGLLVGSEGALGVLTEVTVRARRRPAAQAYEGWFFRSWEQACAALRALVQEGAAPDVVRLSDPDETRAQLALAGPGGVRGRLGRAALAVRGYRGGCLAVLGWDGTARAVRARRAASFAVARRHGALSAGTSVGERWARSRFAGPYLRDDLLDAGVLVETLETAASWSALPATYDAVRRALHGALSASPPVVMCHVSHLYRSGASLYFTVLARQDEHDPVGQWQRAKTAATDAIVAAGATITHHHAVGADHRNWMTAEVGPLGVQVLRAVKSVLDPTGVLNPGKLLPPEAPAPGG
jgi:alkyldihydroxyacetonephosphate synthase